MGESVRLRLCVWMALLVGIGAVPARAELPSLPREVCAIVECHDVEALTQQLQAYVNSIVPGLPMAGIKEDLGGLMKTASPASINWTEPVQLLVLQPPLAAKPALVYTVNDPQQYLDALTPGVQKTSENGGLYFFSEPGGSRVRGRARQFVIALEGNRAAISRDGRTAGAVLQLIRDGRLPAGDMLPGDGVTLLVEPAKLMAGVQRVYGDAFGMLKGIMMSSALRSARQGSLGMSPQEFTGVIDTYLGAARGLLSQMESVMVSVSADAEHVGVVLSLQATEGGGMARYFGSVPQGDLRMLKYLPADAWMVGAGKQGDWGPMLDWLAGTAEQLSSAQAGMSSMAELLREGSGVLSLYGDETAFAVKSGGDGRLEYVQVVTVKDPTQFAVKQQEMMDLTRTFLQKQAAAGPLMDMSYNPSAAEYKGHVIGRVEMTMDFSAADTGQIPQVAQVMAMQKLMMDRLFGPTLVSHTAFLGNDFVTVGGGHSLDALKAIIDGQTASIGESKAFQAGLASMPAGYSGVARISLGGLANWYVPFLSVILAEMGGPAQPFLQSVRFGEGPGIFITSHFSGRTAECNASIPAREIQVLVDGFNQAMMRMQPGAGTGMPAQP